MPGWKDLGNDPSEPVNDDPADSIEMKKIGARREVAARNVRVQAWGIPDLTSILAGDDPQKLIVRRQTDYWQRANKLTLLGILKGVLADNVANDAGDLVRITGASIVDTDIIEAAYLMGDRADKFKTIWMHSKQMKALKLADLIDYVPPSEQGGPLIPYYMGLRAVIDDDIPVAAGVYTAFTFKDKAILWNELPAIPRAGRWSSTASRARAMAAASPKWPPAGISSRMCPAPASSMRRRRVSLRPMPSWRWRRTGTARRRASST
ncbi:hypothetical protein [Mesorhizobium sp.]|uniref:hypothetical protein n=1 Tax=Mesorhizobium sp. TaxID=1871066 RepID=UPI002579C0E8|nr:hypothetical protein [Mesorhizobium sp.]